MGDRATDAGLADGGDVELAQPGGIAVDSVGNVYVANTDENQIKAFAPISSAERGGPWRMAACSEQARRGKERDMDSNRFDRLSRRFAVRGVSRRQTLRGLGAAGLAGVLFALRREHAAADCPDITDCYRPCGAEQGVCLSGFDPHFYIPNGPYGSCWDWSSFTCKPCSSSITWESLHAVCNATHPRCYGECKASFYIP